MTDPTFSTHISCTADWQPAWRQSSADVMYFLQLLCSNWLIILVVSLVATPTGGQQMSDDKMYKVIPRYLDQQSCVRLTQVDRLDCNCTGIVRPPPELPKELTDNLPWERGTTTVANPPTTTMTSIPTTTKVIPDSTTADSSTAGSTTTPSTETTESSSTTPIISTPQKATNKTSTTPDKGKSTTVKTGTVTKDRDTTIAVAIVITGCAVCFAVIVIFLVLFKTQRGRRGKYEIQQAFTRIVSRNRRPSPNANGTANNQQTDIEINPVEPQPFTNGGTPAKIGTESEVASDQEGGNVNSQMIKKNPEPSQAEVKDERKLSKTPVVTEDHRPSRQIRMDSEAPLMDNEDEDTDDQEEGNVNSQMLEKIPEPSDAEAKDERKNSKTPADADNQLSKQLGTDTSDDGVANNTEPAESKDARKMSKTPADLENRRQSRATRMDSEAPLMDNVDDTSDDQEEASESNVNSQMLKNNTEPSETKTPADMENDRLSKQIETSDSGDAHVQNGKMDDDEVFNESVQNDKKGDTSVLADIDSVEKSNSQ